VAAPTPGAFTAPSRVRPVLLDRSTSHCSAATSTMIAAAAAAIPVNGPSRLSVNNIVDRMYDCSCRRAAQGRCVSGTYQQTGEEHKVCKGCWGPSQSSYTQQPAQAPSRKVVQAMLTIQPSLQVRRLIKGNVQSPALAYCHIDTTWCIQPARYCILDSSMLVQPHMQHCTWPDPHLQCTLVANQAGNPFLLLWAQDCFHWWEPLLDSWAQTQSWTSTAWSMRHDRRRLQ
jgi:hypothetical protein